MPGSIIYANSTGIQSALTIKAVSDLKYLRTVVKGPGELSMNDATAAKPIFKASVDGSYILTVKLTNEVGGTRLQILTIIYDSTPPLLNDIAPITTSANRLSVKAEADDNATAYRWEILSAPTGAAPTFKDANSATAEVTLPSLGVYKFKVSLTSAATLAPRISLLRRPW